MIDILIIIIAALLAAVAVIGAWSIDEAEAYERQQTEQRRRNNYLNN